VRVVLWRLGWWAVATAAIAVVAFLVYRAVQGAIPKVIGQAKRASASQR
jgi:hypothetical protein